MMPTIDISSLTPAERLDLIGQLWDSLNNTVADVPLTVEQAAELDRDVEGRGERPSLYSHLDLDSGLGEPRPDIAKAFHAFAERWRWETGVISDSEQIAMHPDYQRIIGMGKIAIPLILYDMASKGGHWFRALTAISGENPVPKEHAGNINAMTQDWLAWARERRYM